MAEADKKTLRVLIAEDNKHDYHLVKRALEKSKYPFNLTWVQTKKDLLESLETSSFDTLILDMNLPDASGLEVLEEINEQGINIPVVFNTGSSTLNMAVEAMHLGASEFLVKDVEGEYVKIIPEVIQKAINQWEDQQARIQAEQALKSSEEKYRQIVEEATDTVYTIDLEGFFTYINQRVKLFTGYSSEELIGKHYSMLVRPDFTDAIQSF